MKGFNKTVLTICAIITVSLVSFQFTGTLSMNTPRYLGTYQTSSTRMSTTNYFCSGVSRTSLSTDSSIMKNDQYRSSFKSAVSVDGNQTINAILDNLSSASTSLMATANGLILFVGPFAVGLALTLLLFPFLQCCCCCPGSCPTKCCCRHSDQNMYTKCQLYWPTIVLLLALSLAASSSAFGLSKASSFSQTMSQVACSISMIPDDLLNGNISGDGTSYFSVLNVLNLDLTSLSANLTTINSVINNFQSTNPNMVATLAATNTMLFDTINGDSNGGSGVPPINYGPSVNSQTSTFPSVFGSFNTSGLLYSFYSGIASLKNNLTTISSNADAYMINSTDISAAITTANNIITPLISSLTNFDQQTGNFMNSFSYTQYGTMGVQIYYSLVIGLTVLSLLGAVIMTFCEKYRCRYLIYFTCFFIVLIALIGFFISIVLSIILPVTSWTCDYLEVALASQAGFDYNFRGMDPNMRTYASACMPFGNGDLMASMGIASLSSLNNLTSLFSYFDTIDITSINSQISNGVNQLASTVGDYGWSKVPDINNYSQLIFMANSSNYLGCTDPNFLLDSYVPSNLQSPQYVSCATAGNNAGSTECTGNFNPKGGSCYGCLDVAQIFQLIPPTSGALITAAVMVRYSGNVGCASFASDLGNIWQQYYGIKETRLYPIGVSVATIVADATPLIAALTILQGSFMTANSTLSSFSNLLDPSYGMIRGLNCKIFGQDFQRVVNSICVTMFDEFYFTRLAIGISSFGLFFSMICIACTGPRHLRQSEKKSKVQDSFQENKRENITIQNLNDTTDKF